jgi:NodT family efflux transporter outer membrane factor (OMF) lipoprotein
LCLKSRAIGILFYRDHGLAGLRSILSATAWVKPWTESWDLKSMLSHAWRAALFYAFLSNALFLMGCTKVGPDFLRPEAAVSPNWMEAGDPRVKSGSSEYRDWWRVFDDPALNGLIDRAYRENLSLRIAGLRVLEARAQLGIVRGELYPQSQQAFGSLEYNRSSAHGAQSAFTHNLSYWQSEIGLSISWEVDFWGKFRRAVDSANANWLASVADYDSALVSLTADVASSHISLRTIEKQLDIARRNVETQEESLKLAEARLKYGSASELDVAQAKTVLNNTLASVPALEILLRQTRNALCILLGMAPNDLANLLEGPSKIPSPPPEVVVGIPADLLKRRPDIRSAEYQAEAQSALIGVAKADLYPALSLSGVFGFLSSDIAPSQLSDVFQWKSRDILAGPAVRWDILNYGQITNNVRVQDTRFQQSLVAYQNTVLQAQQEVENSLSAFLRAQERADFLAKSAAAARRSVDLALLQYQEGVRDFTTVLTAQQTLLAEQDNLVTTLGNISLSLVGVYRALGGGWQIREGNDLVPPETKEAMMKRTNWGNLLAPAVYMPPAAEIPESLIRPPDW